jgi:3-hydroxyacyl-CoA dehydrogenase / enoyl-CoA hydratase / 3-hydroxybutyryl-CoA epimerase
VVRYSTQPKNEPPPLLFCEQSEQYLISYVLFISKSALFTGLAESWIYLCPNIFLHINFTKKRQQNMIRYEKDTHNIVTLTLEMEGSPYNIISHDIGKSFVSVLRHLKSEKKQGLLRGVIITSGKKNFLHGGDLEFYYNCTDPKEIFETSQNISHFFRELESPGVPVVAAINGTALGPGFGLALACHHRVVLDKPDIMLGLPETSLGLMPNGGEIIRLMWLLGIEKAYHITCDGHYYSPKE